MRKDRIACILVFGFVAVAVGWESSAQETSTTEERSRWVDITHKLENNPLDESLNKDGESALTRLSDVHDIHVPLCPAFLSEFNGMKYVYSHTITRQYMLASAAFLIENPAKAEDANAVNLAGVESVLRLYDSILKQKPNAKAKTLDNLRQKQSQGKLPESVRKKC